LESPSHGPKVRRGGIPVVAVTVVDTWIQEVPEWVSRVMIQGPDPWSDMELGPGVLKMVDT